jgi:hypothetical protein
LIHLLTWILTILNPKAIYPHHLPSISCLVLFVLTCKIYLVQLFFLPSKDERIFYFETPQQVFMNTNWHINNYG